MLCVPAVMACLLLVYFVVIAAARADEPRFNALDAADPLHDEYQSNLCSGSAKLVSNFESGLAEMDVQNTALMSAGDRLNWAMDYIVLSELLAHLRAEYRENC